MLFRRAAEHRQLGGYASQQEHQALSRKQPAISFQRDRTARMVCAQSQRHGNGYSGRTPSQLQPSLTSLVRLAGLCRPRLFGLFRSSPSLLLQQGGAEGKARPSEQIYHFLLSPSPFLPLPLPLLMRA